MAAEDVKAVALTAAITVIPLELANRFVYLYERIDAMGGYNAYQAATWVLPLGAAVLGGVVGARFAPRPGHTENPRLLKVHVIQGVATVFIGWRLWRHGIPLPPIPYVHQLVPALLGGVLGLLLRGSKPVDFTDPAVIDAVAREAALRASAAPAAPAAPLAPKAPSRLPGLCFKLFLGLVVLAGLGFGGYQAWLFLTRKDRALASLGQPYVVAPSEDRRWLVEAHGDDPKVTAAFAFQLERLAEEAKSTYTSRFNDELALMGKCFAKKAPEPTDSFVAAVAHVYARCSHDPAKAWVPGWEKDARVTKALLEDLATLGTGNSYSSTAKDLLPAVKVELVARKTPLEQTHVDAIVIAAVRHEVAAANEWLLALGQDARSAAALARELTRLSKQSPAEDRALGRVAKALVTTRAPLDDALLDATIDAYALSLSPELVELLRVQGPTTAKKVREKVQKIESREAKLLAARLDPKDEDVPLVLDAAALATVPLYRVILDQDTSKGRASPVEAKWEPMKYQEEARRTLVELGKASKAALPAIGKGLEHASRGAAWAATRALAELDPVVLVDELEKRIDLYNRKATRLTLARTLLDEADAKTRELARDAVVEGQPLAQGVAEGLLALESMVGLLSAEGTGTDRVDLCFMRGLSSTDAALAKYCARVLKARLDRDRFIDTLFRFLARKESFNMTEVDVYEGALKSFGLEAGPGIVRNLEKLLDAAKGSPAEVFWIHKAIGLRCLATTGTADALPTLDKFAKDPGSYVHTSTKTDRNTGKVIEKKETEVKYKSLCTDAAAKIQARSGGK